MFEWYNKYKELVKDEKKKALFFLGFYVLFFIFVFVFVLKPNENVIPSNYSLVKNYNFSFSVYKDEQMSYYEGKRYYDRFYVIKTVNETKETYYIDEYSYKLVGSEYTIYDDNVFDEILYSYLIDHKFIDLINKEKGTYFFNDNYRSYGYLINNEYLIKIGLKDNNMLIGIDLKPLNDNKDYFINYLFEDIGTVDEFVLENNEVVTKKE